MSQAAEARLAKASFDLGPPIQAAVTKSAAGYIPLAWSATDCIRLRGVGGISISPLGLCPTKVATNAKAAAVPAALSDEELYLAHKLGWVVCTDAVTGKPFDAATALDHALSAARDVEQRQRMLLKRAAFMDLWIRGYRMTSGLKFGVDYLAYRSDPSVCHAAFMVRVLRAGTDITPLDLVARARVATTTLKTAVLAYVDLTDWSVRYEAFKRMGPGQAVFAAASAMALPLTTPHPRGSLPWEQGIGLEGGEGEERADAASATAAMDTAGEGSAVPQSSALLTDPVGAYSSEAAAHNSAEPPNKRQRVVNLDSAPNDESGAREVAASAGVAAEMDR